MLVESLRLIIVTAVVLAADKLAVARPSLLGRMSPQTTVLIFIALGAGIGYAFGGVIARTVDRMLKGAEEHVARRHASDILAATIGFLIGGLITLLISLPVLLFVHPGWVAATVTAFVALTVVTFTSRLSVRKRTELFGVLGVMPSVEGLGGGCLLDSSAAIDGRVLVLFKAGLLPQPICVPAFVIWEMQGLADAGEPLRRRRGQRGLDVLTSLREAGAQTKVLDDDPAAITDPDAKLVVVARRRGLPIVTSDVNLAKVAEMQGVSVLNLHQLAELVRPPVLPGEKTSVRIVRAGRERGQGIAYLADGTMIVVEGAAEMVEKDVEIEVTSVQQTTSGRLLFAKLGVSPTLREAR